MLGQLQVVASALLWLTASLMQGPSRMPADAGAARLHAHVINAENSLTCIRC